MRTIRAGIAAFAFGALFAAGCSQGGSAALAPVDTDPKAVEALVARLTSEPFKGKATAAADIAAVRDLLPKDVALTWGNLSFEAATGATLLTGVKLSPAGMDSVGIGIDELRLYDFDAELAKARLSGQRLSETAALARRIDATGVRLFGLADLMNTSMPAVEETGDEAEVEPQDCDAEAGADCEPAPVEPDASDEPVAPEGDNFQTQFEKLEVGYGRVIFDDVVLRPYEMTPAKAGADPNDPLAELMPLLQPIVAVSRSFGVDAVAMLDLKADVAMNEMGQNVAVSAGVKAMGFRGMRGGDLDAGFMRDLSYRIAGGDGTPEVQTSISLYGVEDIRLDKLYAYLAKGQFPARTDADLLSAGRWNSENEAWKIGGFDVYSVGESQLDARKFHWFIPTDIKASGKNISINVGNILRLGEKMDASVGVGGLKPMIAVLEKYGMDKPVMNYNLGWNWNATSGDAQLELGFGAEKMMQFNTRYEGGFPSFSAVSALVPEDVTKTDEAAITKLFDTKSTLKLVDFTVTDSGGLDKIFNLLADMGPAIAEADPSMGNPFEGQTGASIRQMAGGLFTVVGAGADMAPFINPISDFIMKGGKLRIAMKPPQPMSWSALAEKLFGSGDDPVKSLKEAGLSVEHSN